VFYNRLGDVRSHAGSVSAMVLAMVIDTAIVLAMVIDTAIVLAATGLTLPLPRPPVARRTAARRMTVTEEPAADYSRSGAIRSG
jgi:hypothetical protein